MSYSDLPKFSQLMLPLLKKYADGKDYHWIDFVDSVANDLKVPTEIRSIPYPNNPNRPVLIDRLGWARTFLKKAKLLEQVSKGTYRITKRGRELLAENLKEITVKRLKEYSDFWDERRQKKSPLKAVQDEEVVNEETPVDLMNRAFLEIETNLKDALLDKVLQMPPQAFETLVMRLLQKMNYGTGQVTRYSKDGGIDGIISADLLGFEKIFFQAKRWKNNVGRKEISQFVGDISLKHARKGIFITTSGFRNEETDRLSKDMQIILMNGEELVNRMVQFNLGVNVDHSFIIKKIDNNFFEEE